MTGDAARGGAPGGAVRAAGFGASAARTAGDGEMVAFGRPWRARQLASAATRSSYGIMPRRYHVERVGSEQPDMSQAQIRLHRSSVIPAQGFLHGFPERVGGVSTGLRSSLNLGARWGDDRENVDRNRRLLAAHAGYDPEQLVATRHVHGTSVWRIGEPLAADAEFDGLVCDRPGPVLGAFAADCIPMLFADPVARVIGSAHAGWRGTVNGIAANVVR